MNRVIAWFVHNPVAANLVAIVMVVGGILAYSGIRQEEFPAIEPEAVQITVEYRGASPEEVEKSVCLRVEEAIEGTPNLDRLTSIAVEGACNWLCRSRSLACSSRRGAARPSSVLRGACTREASASKARVCCR